MSEELNNEVTVEATEEVVVEETKVEEAAPAVEEPAVVEAPAVEADVISTPEPASEKPGLGYVGNGAMGSTTVPKNYAKKPAKTAQADAAASEETVALFSTRNVRWDEVGTINRGFNIVTKAQADKWLSRDHVRVATPEEVAKGYGL